jgi:hypothetical protein
VTDAAWLIAEVPEVVCSSAIDITVRTGRVRGLSWMSGLGSEAKVRFFGRRPRQLSRDDGENRMASVGSRLRPISAPAERRCGLTGPPDRYGR